MSDLERIATKELRAAPAAPLSQSELQSLLEEAKSLRREMEALQRFAQDALNKYTSHQSWS